MNRAAIMKGARFVDLFAGWGGFTLAAEQAGGRVVWAANHNPLCVRAHAANHPEPRTIHVCQDLNQADWGGLPAYDVMLASPECPSWSQAGQPGRARSKRVRKSHETARATAWAVIGCAEVTQPRAIIVENVPDFGSWGPPRDPRNGAMFWMWCAALETLGYAVGSRVLTASRHSATPQRRDRLFVVAILGGTARDVAAVLNVPRRRAEPAIGPCLDWTAGRWRDVATSTPGVRGRVAKGRRNHGRRFVTQHVTGHPGVGLSEPIRTITTKDQWALVDGAKYRPLTIRENARAMGFPDSYHWPADAKRSESIKGIGNAVPPPLARVVIERLGGVL